MPQSSISSLPIENRDCSAIFFPSKKKKKLQIRQREYCYHLKLFLFCFQIIVSDPINYIRSCVYGILFQVLEAIRYGQTKGTKCLVIQPHNNKPYNASNINSHIKRCNLGTSQARMSQKESRNVRTTLLYTEAFDQEELDLLLKGAKYLQQQITV